MKKRTRVSKIPEGHTVAWHELMSCAVCRREFWGVCSWDAHWPCKNVEYTRVAHNLYRIPGTDVTFYNEPGRPFVILGCHERYQTMMTRVQEAREARKK